MIAAGFDYGTSNCALAAVIAGRVQFAPLEDGARLLPSTLWAPAPDLARIRRDRYGRPLPPGPAISLHGEAFRGLRFGSAAIERHLADPANGFYVRSPKSFLGAAGLGEDLRERFRDIVAAMMLTVRERAEQAFGAPLRQVVVGRPVNFQGPGEASHNAQAEAMLRAAAHAAGFTDVAFLFEPLAAALDYEVRLDHDVRALVVDIGGGTTDVSFVELGPRRRTRIDRTADVLAHAGERVGGNDFDQLLALRQLMPAFGYGAVGRNGLPVPNTLLVDAVTVNDVNAQARFYGSAGGSALQAWRREVEPAVLLQRLAAVRERRLTWRIARTAEHAKIALSAAATAPAALDYVEPGLVLQAARGAFADQAWRLLERITALVDEALAQAGTTPQVVYLTGGMAGAPMVRARIGQRLPAVPVVDGDHFASVVEGLAHHAHRLFGAAAR